MAILASWAPLRAELLERGAAACLSKLLKKTSDLSNSLQQVAWGLINLYHSDSCQHQSSLVPLVLQPHPNTSMLTGGSWTGSVMTSNSSLLEHISWHFEEKESCLCGSGVNSTSQGIKGQHSLQVQFDGQQIHISRTQCNERASSDRKSVV